MIRFAVITFPGSTGEREAVAAFLRSGMEAEVVRWNEPEALRSAEHDGYFLPGGRSFGGAARGGMVASREPVMEIIREGAGRGKVVLGVGDGAQALVEGGLVPGCDGDALACALAPNAEGRYSGEWALLKDVAPRGRSAFGDSGGLLRLPLATQEGRFVFATPEALARARENSQILYEYVGSDGRRAEAGVGNPTGSVAGVAALCNPAGNVMAMVPQPERAPGSGDAIFRSIKNWIGSRRKVDYPPMGACGVAEDVRAWSRSAVEVLVSPGFQDGELGMVAGALGRAGFKINLRKYQYLPLGVGAGLSREKVIERLLTSGVVTGLRGERAMVRLEGDLFEVRPGEGLRRVDSRPEHWVAVMSKAGLESRGPLGRRLGEYGEGVVWEVEGADKETMYALLRTKILYNPAYQYVMMA